MQFIHRLDISENILNLFYLGWNKSGFMNLCVLIGGGLQVVENKSAEIISTKHNHVYRLASSYLQALCPQ